MKTTKFLAIVLGIATAMYVLNQSTMRMHKRKHCGVSHRVPSPPVHSSLTNMNLAEIDKFLIESGRADMHVVPRGQGWPLTY